MKTTTLKGSNLHRLHAMRAYRACPPDTKDRTPAAVRRRINIWKALTSGLSEAEMEMFELTSNMELATAKRSCEISIGIDDASEWLTTLSRYLSEVAKTFEDQCAVMPFLDQLEAFVEGRDEKRDPVQTAPPPS